MCDMFLPVSQRKDQHFDTSDERPFDRPLGAFEFLRECLNVLCKHFLTVTPWLMLYLLDSGLHAWGDTYDTGSSLGSQQRPVSTPLTGQFSWRVCVKVCSCVCVCGAAGANQGPGNQVATQSKPATQGAGRTRRPGSVGSARHHLCQQCKPSLALPLMYLGCLRMR